MLKIDDDIMRKIMTLIAVILGITVTAGAVANALENKDKEVLVPTTWYFIGDDLSDATTASPDNWTKVDPELGCGTGDDLPCAMTVEGASNHTELQQFLNGKTATQIRDNYADSKRAE